jgi:16S rRNA processing protein RimM
MSDAAGYLVIGRIIDVYGLKGWVKVKSFTQPETNFLQYEQCLYQKGGSWLPLVIKSGKQHGKGLVVKFDGYDDRTAAESIMKLDLAIKIDDLPVLDEDEYYWHQLESLQVYVTSESGESLLGKVDHLLETGSNDVLMIKPCDGSIDKRERLLPYRPEVVKSIDLVAAKMIVEWDIEF